MNLLGPAGPQTTARAVILVRVMVGVVFLAEGILKLLQPDVVAERFTKIGIPAPGVMGPFVGWVEIIGGALVLVGLFTRLAAIPLLINISVAILSTKVPVLIGRGFWGFAAPQAPHHGLLSFIHEARTDLCMWLGLLFLLIVGAGLWSVDRLFRPAGGKGQTS